MCFPEVWAPKELSIFTAVCSAILAVVAVSGNSIIVVAVIKDPLKKLHSPFNYFLINLAVADLILGTVVLPISVYSHYKESIGEVTNATRIVLRVSYFISATASLLSLMALSLDRFVAITRAMKYRQLLSYSRCIIVSVVIWVLSLSLPFLYFVFEYINYLIFYANVAVLVGIVVTALIYVRVYVFLSKHTRDLRKELRLSSSASKEFDLKQSLMQKKVTYAFLIILFVFVFTYIPAVVIIYVFYLCESCSCDVRHVLRDLQFILVAGNSCVNPFICTIRLKQFRQSIKHILKSHKISDMTLATKRTHCKNQSEHRGNLNNSFLG